MCVMYIKITKKAALTSCIRRKRHIPTREERSGFNYNRTTLEQVFQNTQVEVLICTKAKSIDLYAIQ